MDVSMIIMWLGFALAAYSVVGNDVIQTLGTFLTSNETRFRWWILFLYAGGILTVSLFIGWFDPFGTLDYKYPLAYGRLDKFSIPEQFQWYHLLPPLVLLSITRIGIPVSTTFMILTLFSLQKIPGDLGSMIGSVFNTQTELGGMIHKSIMGYIIAFLASIIIYLTITKITEKKYMNSDLESGGKIFWSVAQWCSTAFLWSQWLIQDLANIYIYLRGGVGISDSGFFISLFMILGLLAFIFYQRGGAVQDVVRSKVNTADIRSATFIDLIYGSVLFIFKDDYFGLWGGKLPMSTTWVFIGLLAGRELAIQIRLKHQMNGKILKMLFLDLGKVFSGLVISVVLVFIIKLLAQ
jgi:hypothetical protein